MSFKIYTILVIILFSAFSAEPPQIFIDCSEDSEQIPIQKLFYDVDDGYYVDVGGYDPITFSNTLNLHSRGWNGINIEANIDRLKLFYYQRPQAINLNIAISSQEDKVISLYQMSQGSCSTTNEKVKQSIIGQFTKQYKIISMTLAQICERFYLRRPTLMSLDIQGVGYQAFTMNNWKNIKCCPQVIISQMNQRNLVVGDKMPFDVLSTNGYKRIIQKVGKNQVYIHQTVFDKYQQKLKKGEQNWRKNIQDHKMNNFFGAMSSIAPQGINFYRHYSPNSHMYVHVARWNQDLNLLKINKFSNQMGPMQDRNILVMNFNPHKSLLMIPNSNYKFQDVKVQAYNFWKVTVTKSDNKKFTVYILDHNYKPRVKPTIIVVDQVMKGKNQEQPGEIGAGMGMQNISPNPNTNPNTCNYQEHFMKSIKNEQNILAQLQNIGVLVRQMQIGDQAKFSRQLSQSNAIKELIRNYNRQIKDITRQNITEQPNKQPNEPLISPQTQPKLSQPSKQIPRLPSQDISQTKSNNKSLNTIASSIQIQQILFLLVSILVFLLILCIMSTFILFKVNKNQIRLKIVQQSSQQIKQNQSFQAQSPQ